MGNAGLGGDLAYGIPARVSLLRLSGPRDESDQEREADSGEDPTASDPM